jgi:hypothetical protein
LQPFEASLMQVETKQPNSILHYARKITTPKTKNKSRLNLKKTLVFFLIG